MSYVAAELRRTRREIVRLNRKVALARLSGKVAEVDAAGGRVRLDLGDDPATGDKVLSPWVRWQSNAAGRVKVYAPPSIGEQMYLASASGVVGADSLATYGAFDNDHPAPSTADDTLVITVDDHTEISATPDGVDLVRGETRISLREDKIVLDGLVEAPKGITMGPEGGGGIFALIRGNVHVEGWLTADESISAPIISETGVGDV